MNQVYEFRPRPIRVFLVIGLMLYLVLMAGVYYLSTLQIESLWNERLEINQQQAINEVDNALITIENSLNSMAREFAESDETRQILNQSEYYSYWYSSHFEDANLADYYLDIQLYNKNGTSLDPSKNSNQFMPDSYLKDISSALTAIDNVLVYRSFTQVFSGDNSHTVGYIGIAVDLVEMMKQVKLYLYIDPEKITFSKYPNSVSSLSEISQYLNYELRGQNIDEEYNQLASQIVTLAFLPLLIILTLNLYFFNILFVRPLFYLTNKLTHPESKHLKPAIAIEEMSNLVNAMDAYEADLLQANSDLSQKNLDLQKAKNEADQANKAKSDFIATMSHEIRTPMNGVIGITQLLKKSSLDEEQMELTQLLQESADSLMHIINDVLDLSKLDSGKIQIELVDFNLQAVLQGTVNIFRQNAQAKGLIIEENYDKNIKQIYRGDVGRFRQVIMNLISNAIKFTEDGKITITAAHITSSPERVRVEVTDTGVGISDAEANNLFQEFTQADASVTRKYGGTGLGLAICKRIVELLGGSIGASGKPGVGSTFWFEVPLEFISETDIESSSSQQEDELSVCEPLDILLVEDIVPNQVIAQKFLERMGHSVEISANGLEAITALQNRSFDLVFMDMQMPEMDGITATKKIRQMDSVAPDLPIIAMTANVTPEDQKNCIAAGMNDFVPKPLNFNKLQQLITEWSQRIAQ